MIQQNLNNKFNLVLCELFNRHIHGLASSQIQEVDGHYLIISKFDGKTKRLLDEHDGTMDIDSYYTDNEDNEDESDNDNDTNETILSSISDFSAFYNEYYNEINLEPHIIIRNYENIISRPHYIKPEIAQCVMLQTQHSIAILKTIWIKLIQRKWKKIYAERQSIMRRRMSPSSLSTRELTGKWPTHCQHLPSIYGMLSSLSR
jgi:hypothetical protein